MKAAQRNLVAINVLGGLLVLGSYAWGFLARPDAMGALWGGVPESARGLYTINMFLAAGGYFLFTPYLIFRLLPQLESNSNSLVPTLCTCFYLAILVPSALWLPMTAAMVAAPSLPLWISIRLVLALVALGSAGLLSALALTRAQDRQRGHTAALLGLLPFSLQTVVLDAVVWPLFFPLSVG
jgi:hypothetical protein